MTHCGLISSDCRFFLRATCMFPLPVSFKGPVIVYYNGKLDGVPAEGSVISKTLWHRKGGFYHMKGEGLGGERKERENWTNWKRIKRGKKYREMSGSGGCVRRKRERGKRGRGGEGRIKAELYSLMWLLCAGSSRLLLQGLLHLHFSLKIAPVIIYLAGAHHPALCFRRIVFFFSFFHFLPVRVSYEIRPLSLLPLTTF